MIFNPWFRVSESPSPEPPIPPEPSEYTYEFIVENGVLIGTLSDTVAAVGVPLNAWMAFDLTSPTTLNTVCAPIESNSTVDISFAGGTLHVQRSGNYVRVTATLTGLSGDVRAKGDVYYYTPPD